MAFPAQGEPHFLHLSAGLEVRLCLEQVVQIYVLPHLVCPVETTDIVLLPRLFALPLSLRPLVKQNPLAGGAFCNPRWHRNQGSSSFAPPLPTIPGWVNVSSRELFLNVRGEACHAKLKRAFVCRADTEGERRSSLASPGVFFV